MNRARAAGTIYGRGAGGSGPRFQAARGVSHIQLTQTGQNDFRLRVLPSIGCLGEAAAPGQRARVKLEPAERLDAEPNGKARRRLTK